MKHMHAIEIKKLDDRINGSLQNCNIKDTWPEFNSYYPHVQNLATEILKHKKEWITPQDVYAIFIDHVFAAITLHRPEEQELNGNLKDILNNIEFSNLIQDISTYLQSIPRLYKVYLPLPEITGLNDTVKITNHFRIEKIVSSESLPGHIPQNALSKLISNEPKMSQYYLVYKAMGYCSRDLISSAAKSALNTYKITLQQALFKNIFSRKNNTAAGLGLIWTNHTHTIPKHYMFVVDQDDILLKKIRIELPIEICRLLESHSFSPDSKSNNIVAGNTQIELFILNNFKTSAQLHATTIVEAARIKAAILWAFDSYVNDNPTMSFVQNCIGLESLYGDDEANENLTRTLSDRCAYLTSSNIKDRNIIREKFRKLYKIRSKIVHGNTSTLAANDESFLDWGRFILEYSISKEIKHLELDQIE